MNARRGTANQMTVPAAETTSAHAALLRDVAICTYLKSSIGWDPLKTYLSLEKDADGIGKVNKVPFEPEPSTAFFSVSSFSFNVSDGMDEFPTACAVWFFFGASLLHFRHSFVPLFRSARRQNTRTTAFYYERGTCTIVPYLKNVSCLRRRKQRAFPPDEPWLRAANELKLTNFQLSSSYSAPFSTVTRLGLSSFCRKIIYFAVKKKIKREQTTLARGKQKAVYGCYAGCLSWQKYTRRQNESIIFLKYPLKS